MTIETHTIPTSAGHSITARSFLPSQTSKAVVVMAGAMGVAQYHYDDFANWLASQGYTAITFDYDGIGLSIDQHVKRSQSDILSWATHDCPALLDYLDEHFPEQKRIWIGHSVGGQIIGMMKDISRLDKVITVACGTGYWRHMSKPTKKSAWALWYVLVPAVVPFAGYYPGNKIKVLSDLPKGVIWQWRKWCLDPRYAVGVEGEALQQQYSDVTIPITSISFTDDEMMSKTNVDVLHSFYEQAPKTMIRVKPEDIAEKRIGHIGWHKARYQGLWEKYIADELAGAL